MCALEDNIVQDIVRTSWEECSLDCDLDEGCKAFNYYEATNTCLLLSSCNEKLPWNDCVVGTEQDKCTCSVNFVSNSSVTIGHFEHIPDEVSCKLLCFGKELCFYYTYYDRSDPATPERCVFHSSLGSDGMESCEHCGTGPSFCLTGKKCQASVLSDGETNQYVFATSSRAASLVATEKDCYVEARALAVGGGGRGPTGYGGGAGSGYINATSLLLTAGDVLTLVVGAQGEASAIFRRGQAVLSAEPGQNYDGNNGGDGYSGGGGYDGDVEGGDGGHDGSDGGDTGSGKGGHGSGLEVGSLSMNRFVISPGKGGVGSSTYGGGGAGGVVVNGQKPTGGTEFDGEGFGAGGFVGAKRNGCVLIEV